MKLIYLTLLFFIFASAVAAQQPGDVLATATGHTFKLADMPQEVQSVISGLPQQIKTTRSDTLEQMVNEEVLSAEAKAKGTTIDALVKAELAKVPAPTDAEIKKIYDANRNAFGGQTIEQAEKQIVSYLRRDPEQKRLNDLVTSLRAKFKAAGGKDVNTPGLAPGDIVATVNGRRITAAELEAAAKLDVHGLQDDAGAILTYALNEKIYQTLVADDAKANGIDPGALIAQEITNKMKDFSDEEQSALEAALRKRLYEKYSVKVLYKEPEPLVENISVDDDPATGPAGAPVTIIMFSDFQCSACAATHPLLKKAMAEHPGKVRLVVRDFPLESIHANAFRAALAANAAHAQGKFFEYTELLYSRQQALDDASLSKYAAELGLNVKQFEIDSKSEKTAAEVRKDIAYGEANSINSTPTIFVNGVRVRNLSLDGLRSAIGRALAK